MENVLAGALRREQIAEASIKELKAEIEQLNLLVNSFFPCSRNYTQLSISLLL